MFFKKKFAIFDLNFNRMKSILSTSIILVLFTSIFVSCKKQSTENELDPKVQQHNEDAGSYKSELDQADNDINNSLSNTGLGKKGGSSPLCGVTIDTSLISQKIIIYNFDGVTPCFSPSKTRSGKIKVQLTAGNKWGDIGSIITQTFMNYKVTRLSDKKSITLNGVKTYKNINGNNWLGYLLGITALKFQERALNIAVTFDNGQTATWNSARTSELKFTPEKTNPAIPYAYTTFSCNGDTSINGTNKVEAWGVNRFGQNFISYYNSPITSNDYCGLWRFNSGELVYNINNADFIFTFGLNENGLPTTLTCAYGFKVTWTNGTASKSILLSY